MPQIILAILALMLATTFAMQQQRNAIYAQMAMIRNDIALKSTSVAEDKLSEIGGGAFDQEVANGSGIANNTALTLPGRFGVGQGESDDGNDIDDFHQDDTTTTIAWRTVQRENASTGVTEIDTLTFSVNVRVEYTDEEGSTAPAPTKYKQATVRVRSRDIENPPTAKVSRLYVCGSACGW